MSSLHHIGLPEVEFLQEVTSTHDVLAERLAQYPCLPHGYSVVAYQQNSGRGREGRPWHSLAGNYHASIWLNVEHMPLAQRILLSYAAAVAVYDTLLTLTAMPSLALKWPNDLLVQGRKLGGMLLEGRENGVLVGIGINLQHAPPADALRYPASSLAEQGVADLTVEQLHPQLLRRLLNGLRQWQERGDAWLLQQWQQRAHPIGSRLQCLRPGDIEPLDGRFMGLAKDGSLLLEEAHGVLHHLQVGDITHITLPEAMDAEGV